MTDHERQVLGAMLTKPAAIDDASDLLTAASFTTPRHGLIFDAILRQAAESAPTDFPAVATALGEDLPRVGGITYLAELVTGLVTSGNITWHCEQVRTAHLRSEIRAAGNDLVAISDYDTDPLEAANAARARIDAVTDSMDRREMNNAVEVYAAIESLEQPAGVKTPWLPLSNAIGGWRPGMLYVVGARPGIGKSVFGVGVILDMARRGHAAAFASMEMPSQDLYLRMLSAVGTVDGESILHRDLSEGDYERMAAAAGKISALDLNVDSRTNLSLAQIRAMVRSVQRKRDVGVLVVDYLGLIKPPPEAPKNDRRVQIDLIAQGLKNLALDLKIPIIALAQLNREIEGRAVKQPTMADLRESGGIEAAADFVILMHRDVIEAPEDLLVAIPKNRHGPPVNLSLTFEGRYSRITEPTWTPTTALGA